MAGKLVLTLREKGSYIVIPEGAYKARLIDVTSQNNTQYGSSLKWDFEVYVPGQEPVKMSAFTAQKLGFKRVAGGQEPSKLRQWINILAGEEVIGDFDITSLIGTQCTVLVQDATTQAGAKYSKIYSIAPLQVMLFPEEPAGTGDANPPTAKGD